MAARLVALPLLALLLALSSCQRPQGPAERYRQFAQAARAGDAERVWSMLSERSQAALDARAAEVAAATPGVIPASGRALVLGDLARRAPRVKSAVVLRESRDAAVVAIEDEAGAKGEVTLVREGGEWRVVLPGAAG